MYPTTLHHLGMIFLELLVATLCGGLIGYQRQAMERPAGFRTHIMVCVGSAIYMLISVQAAGKSFDPTRIAAQVATGVGFLGAGTIIKMGSSIHGLTTAASIWAVAGIGLAAGFGIDGFAIAFIGTGIVLLALTVMRQVEMRAEGMHHGFELVITARDPRKRLDELRALFTTHAIDITAINIEDEVGGMGQITLIGHTPSHKDLDLLLDELAKNTSVRSVEREYR